MMEYVENQFASLKSGTESDVTVWPHKRIALQFKRLENNCNDLIDLRLVR